MNERFSSFAAYWQKKFANPIHFVGFCVMITIWLVVLGPLMHFSDTWQLMVNTPTTLAEYIFEILGLAAGLAAKEGTERIIAHLLEHNQKLDLALERIESKEAKLDVILQLFIIAFPRNKTVAFKALNALNPPQQETDDTSTHSTGTSISPSI